MAVLENDVLVGPVTPADGVTTISLDFDGTGWEAAWLEVYKTGSETPLVLGTDYTVSGAGTVSAVVTLTNPANGTDAYSVFLVTPLERSSDMQLRGEFKSEPFNVEMDRIWQRLQLHWTHITRSLRLSATSAMNTILSAVSPGQLVQMKADGTGFIGYDPNITVSQVDAWYHTRGSAQALAAAALDDGSIVSMNGLLYKVDSAATGSASATNDLGVDGLVAIGRVVPAHFGATGNGVADDTAALQSAVAASDRVSLDNSHVLTAQMSLNDWQLIEGDNRSQIKMQPGNTIIAMLAPAKQGFHLRNFRVDGASGGQLDAGLIQINGCSDFLIEDVTLENGGTVGAASPQGVNGFSFATDAYPGGSKSSGRISRVTTRNFTKAPFNWTTFAEGGILSDSEFYDSVGNGQTPGIQVNGGRKLKAHNNLVDGTEGAGVAIASVGTTPAYASQDIELAFNTYRRIGELGQTNSEQFVYLISDGQAAGDLENIHISNEVIEGCAGGILKTAGNVSEIRLDNIRSRNTQGGYDLQDVDDVKLTRLTVEDFNSDNNASLGLFSLRGATNVVIDGADINSEGSDTTGLIVSCTVASSDVRIKNVHYEGALTLIGTSDTDYLTDAVIEATTEKVSTASTNTTIQLLKVPDGRTIQADIEVSTASGSIYATQRLKVSADAAAGVATIRENALLFDSKAGIATGLFADVTASNVLRVRFLNSSASNLDLHLKVKLIID